MLSRLLLGDKAPETHWLGA